MVDHVETKMDVAYLPAVEGSMTSEDGQAFVMHVKRPRGGDLLLGLPAQLLVLLSANAFPNGRPGQN
jgi:hypothetical protein